MKGSPHGDHHDRSGGCGLPDLSTPWPRQSRVAYGSYDFAANPTAADIIKLCKLPAGAVVLDGFLRMEDIDTNGTETLDIDIGWAANGGTTTPDAADPDGFGNFGAGGAGDAVVGYLPEGGTRYPLHGTLKDGPVAFTKETTVQAVVNVAAATFTAGTLTVVVYFVVP